MSNASEILAFGNAVLIERMPGGTEGRCVYP
jgi:hypothetical protein